MALVSSVQVLRGEADLDTPCSESTQAVTSPVALTSLLFDRFTNFSGLSALTSAL